MNKQTLERLLKYDSIVQVWKKFCLLHTELYDLTCEEYINLLASDFEKLEATVHKKENVLNNISRLENERQLLIEEINKNEIFVSKVNNIQELLESLSEIEAEKNNHHLYKFNSLLISIIERIQEQNKRNQIFLNRAMLNLREIKNSFTGKKSYHTYNASGTTR